MCKTVINSLALVISVLCLLVLGACPPEADEVEDTETIKVTNIPLKVLETGLDPYKIYVQLAKTMKASDGYVAKGEKILTAGQTEVTITGADIKDESGIPWTGSEYGYVNILISPEYVASIDEIDSRAGTASPAKTLKLKWEGISLKSAVGLGFIQLNDYHQLYKDIIIDDSDIKGAKAQP
jgi:hypothetical protein